MGDATTKIQKFVASTSAPLLDQTDSNALFIPQSIAPGNIAGQLIDAISPKYLIYSQAPPKNTSKPAKAISKKPLEDPLETVSDENRFNLKERGELKIVSDGKSLDVK